MIFLGLSVMCIGVRTCGIGTVKWISDKKECQASSSVNCITAASVR